MKVVVYAHEGGDLFLPIETRKLMRRRILELGGDITFENEHEEALEKIEDAEVLFGYITPTMLKKAGKLKWVQAPIASFGSPQGEYYVFPELAQSEIMLTSMSGIYSDIIATHVFAFITNLSRSLHTHMRNQIRHIWDKSDVETIRLQGKTLCVIGLGGIGKEVARLGSAFGMRITAVEPKPYNVPSVVEEVSDPDDLQQVLTRADFVVLCLPDAPETAGMMGEEEFKAMKKTAYLVNIGRGRTVELDSLMRALENGWIAGAGLDVFPPEHEPLPPDHPIWDMENVIITPHTAGRGTPPERRAEVFLENFDRYIHGQKLLNLVDKKRMVLSGPGYDLS